ncbi:hypothetical protein GWK47_000064 [Chionoecetes opilio]|uniref:Uncharacterized protein n=1 Tax=Chionoecetes opilio TaxID=41210 RepID=A0A8J5CWD1_CHIOP|nr:hypothetical protein GWK47_000064 [Chionoecetes opilio]
MSETYETIEDFVICYKYEEHPVESLLWGPEGNLLTSSDYKLGTLSHICFLCSGTLERTANITNKRTWPARPKGLTWQVNLINLKMIRGQTLSFGLYDIRPLGEQFIHGSRTGYGRVVLNKHIIQVPRPPTDLQCCAQSPPRDLPPHTEEEHQHIVYSSNQLGLGDGGRSGRHSNQDVVEIRRHKIVCAARGMAVNSHLGLAITQETRSLQFGDRRSDKTHPARGGGLPLAPPTATSSALPGLTTRRLPRRHATTPARPLAHRSHTTRRAYTAMRHARGLHLALRRPHPTTAGAHPSLPPKAPRCRPSQTPLSVNPPPTQPSKPLNPRPSPAGVQPPALPPPHCSTTMPETPKAAAPPGPPLGAN